MRMLLAEGEAFYPQFATHNAHTVASAHVAGAWQTFEMQRLHGMGQAIYAEVVDPAKLNRPCRIYAPVGEHKDLLPYLVRRLLENGANASFVNRLADDEVPVESIVRDPVEIVTATATRPDATPPLAGPARIFLPERRNSAGVALWDSTTRRDLEHEIEEALAEPIEAAPIIGGSGRLGGARERTTVLSPHDRRVRVGFVTLAGPADIEDAIVQAASAQAIWDRRGGAGRADILL
jgi:RHH-type proline utilization regulon transcriptional repressor/proline dehydrogenase/delta 1-pyrroline-5-carboxylate dehydrogenase